MRVPKERWEKAKRKASDQRRSLNEVMNKLLQGYIDDPDA